MARAHTLLNETIESTLAPVGFGRQGGQMRRSACEVPQVVAAVASRFGTGAISAAWIECQFGMPSLDRQSRRKHEALKPVLSLRHHQIASRAPAYYSEETIAAAERDLKISILPFLERATTVDGFIGALEGIADDPNAYQTVKGKMLARVRRMEEPKAAFSRSSDEPRALRRIAASFGVTLEQDS